MGEKDERWSFNNNILCEDEAYAAFREDEMCVGNRWAGNELGRTVMEAYKGIGR